MTVVCVIMIEYRRALFRYNACKSENNNYYEIAWNFSWPCPFRSCIQLLITIQYRGSILADTDILRVGPAGPPEP